MSICEKLKNVAVILAAGVGKRAAQSTPKQYVSVRGRDVIEHTVENFENHIDIDEIWLVLSADYLDYAKDLCEKNKWSKVTKFLLGGAQRTDSTMAAINECGEESNLIFHDCARPLVSKRIISDVVEALRTYDAVGVAVPVTDTIVEKDGDFIGKMLDREVLVSEQTPQAFRFSLIRDAYSVAFADPNFAATDDCGVVKKYLPSVPIFIVQGERTNIKVTTPEDFVMLEMLLK